MGKILIEVTGIIYNDIEQEDKVFKKIVEIFSDSCNSRGHAFIMAYNTVFAWLIEFTNNKFEIVALEVLTDGDEEVFLDEN